jgi:hypothetical protein
MANHPAKVECPAVAEMVRALKSVIPELRGHIGTIRDDGSCPDNKSILCVIPDANTPTPPLIFRKNEYCRITSSSNSIAGM